MRSGSSSAGGTRSGMLAWRILFLARVIRWPTAVSLCSSARAISVTVNPDTKRRVSASCDCRSSAGCAQVNIIRSSSSRTGYGSLPSVRARISSTGFTAANSFPGRAVSRRSRSRARLRATVTSHPPGLSGTPSRCQVRSASAQASWTASSAMVRSPDHRASAATAGPHSRRKTPSRLRIYSAETPASCRTSTAEAGIIDAILTASSRSAAPSR